MRESNQIHRTLKGYINQVMTPAHFVKYCVKLQTDTDIFIKL